MPHSKIGLHLAVHPLEAPHPLFPNSDPQLASPQIDIKIYNNRRICFIVGAESNFLKYSHGEIDHLREPYDYGSITHYGAKFFSNDGKLTTISKRRPGGPKMGQRKQLSAIDVDQMNKLYRCTAYISM